MQQFEVNIPEITCVTWNIYDSYGDGICCDWGKGYVRLLDTETRDELLYVNGDYGDGTTTLFAAPDPTIGINENYTEKVQIFPNPAKNKVMVLASDEITKIQIINYTGQLVLEQKENGTNSELNVAELEPGIYFIKIFSRDQIITRRLVIE